ncbi:MAG: response regulator, partial [Gemmatimonadaceae bacterium]|nr:response regulator [Acetobacteraceae bacterium]
EDEPLVRMITAGMLADLGHDVIEAGSGGEALSRLDDADLVVCDLGLPDMDGMALVDALRARRPGIPIVVASGAAGPEGRSVVWLAKPYDEPALKAALIGAMALPGP